jgi:hypothetical protein
MRGWSLLVSFARPTRGTFLLILTGQEEYRNYRFEDLRIRCGESAKWTGRQGKSSAVFGQCNQEIQTLG